MWPQICTRLHTGCPHRIHRKCLHSCHLIKTVSSYEQAFRRLNALDSLLWILCSDWVKVVPWRVKGKTKSWNSVRKLDPNLQDLVYFWILDQESWYTRCEAYQNTWWDRSLAYDVVHRGQRWAEWPSTFTVHFRQFTIAPFRDRRVTSKWIIIKHATFIQECRTMNGQKLVYNF